MFNINTAIETAVKAYVPQRKNDKDVPDLAHPIEVSLILAQNGANEEVIAAGILHDTIARNELLISSIESEFGQNVVSLINYAALSDKNAEQGLKYLKSEAGIETKLITCADKLSGVKYLSREYKRLGNELWINLNIRCSHLKWYYENLILSLSSLYSYRMYSELIQEVNSLFKNKNVLEYIEEEETNLGRS